MSGIIPPSVLDKEHRLIKEKKWMKVNKMNENKRER